MPDTLEPDDLSRLESILASSPRARSPLFRWLMDHFDKVGRLVRRYGKNWTAMAAGLNQIGVTRRNGAPVGPDSLRKTWNEVSRVETARRKEEAVAARRRVSDPPAEDAVPAQVSPGSSPEPEFKPARLKSGYRASAAAGSGPVAAVPDGGQTSRRRPT